MAKITHTFTYDSEIDRPLTRLELSFLGYPPTASYVSLLLAKEEMVEKMYALKDMQLNTIVAYENEKGEKITAESLEEL